MKIYLYVKGSANDYDESFEFTAYKSKSNAVKQLKQDRDTLLDYWKDDECGVIERDAEDSFEAYEDGYYARNNDHLFIKELEVLD